MKRCAKCSHISRNYLWFGKFCESHKTAYKYVFEIKVYIYIKHTNLYENVKDMLR